MMTRLSLYRNTLLFVVLVSFDVVTSFVTRFQSTAPIATSNKKPVFVRSLAKLDDFEYTPEEILESTGNNCRTLNNNERLNKIAIATSTIWMTSTQMALADSPDWGLFEGKIGSLLHPITMGGLFLFSLYTGYLGFQWRRQRTIGEEITTLKKSIPDLDGAQSVSVALASAKEANDLYKVNSLTAALEIEAKVNELVAERKQLAEAGPRDKHFEKGALLAFIGTCFAIEGPLNTYARAGKLFPGPHLYAGAGLVCLWALAAACVPSMQKGNDLARSVHIGANVVGIAMFAWQVSSGIPILFKVYELTKWP